MMLRCNRYASAAAMLLADIRFDYAFAAFIEYTPCHARRHDVHTPITTSPPARLRYFQLLACRRDTLRRQDIFAAPRRRRLSAMF